MFRVGKVTSTDAAKHTVRVQFSEPAGGYESHDLPVLVTRPGDYALPAKDTMVLCAVEDGAQGIGYVLGALYNDENAPPLSDAGQRSVASDDLRLGTPDASDKVALAPATKGNDDGLHGYLAALDAIVSGAPIPEAGLGAPSAFQTALKAAVLAAGGLPSMSAVAAEKVRAK